jgi:hypothetical protein
MDKHRIIGKKLIDLIYNLIKFHYVEVKKIRENIIAKLRTNPTEVRALSELKKFILELPMIVGQMTAKIDHMYEM